MAVSGMMAYVYIGSDYYQTWQKVIYSIPDFFQIFTQFYLASTCIVDGWEDKINFAYFLVSAVKGMQGLVLIPVVIEALNTAQEDYFIASFGAIKFVNNAFDAIDYFLFQFTVEDLEVN